MRRVVIGVLVAGIAVAIAWIISAIPGSVSARIGDVEIEVATPVALMILAVGVIAIHLVLRLVGGIAHVPIRFSRRRRDRRRRQGEEAVTRTLLALAAGVPTDARRDAGKARALLGDTPQTLLLTAEANRLAGREDEAEAAFRALTNRRDAAFLGYRGLLRQAIAREDWAEAASLARKAETAHPGAKWPREERAHLAVRAGNWAEALELADTDIARAALAAAAANAEPEPTRARRLARQAWRLDPSLAPAALAHARRMRGNEQESRVSAVINEAWAAQPHPDLAAFLLEPITDPLARARAAQKLAATNPDHVESHFLLARTALDAGLTGEARHHLDILQRKGINQRRVWLLQAETEEKASGDTQEGRQAQREALRRAAAADADPGWRCEACDTAHATWHPACPSCLRAGHIRWGAGLKIMTLPTPARDVITN